MLQHIKVLPPQMTQSFLQVPLSDAEARSSRPYIDTQIFESALNRSGAQKDREDNNNHYTIYPPYQCACSHCVENCTRREFSGATYQLDPEIEEEFKNMILATRFNEPQIRSDGEFLTLALNLMPPEESVKPLQLGIQDTLFFRNKEPFLLVYNQTKDQQLVFQLSKDKLNFQALRFFFIKRRQEYEVWLNIWKGKSVNQKGSDFKNSKLIQELKLQQKQQLANNNNQLVHIFFNTANNESVILNQNQFNNYMDRKKNDAVWETVFYIQSCAVDKKNILAVKFDYRQALTDASTLFARARQDVEAYSQPNYSQLIFAKEEVEFCKLLKTNNRGEYLNYLTYKMHHYIDLHHHIKLMHASISFVRDELGNYIVIDCKDIAFSNLQSIKFQSFFQHYIKHYSEKLQDELIEKFSALKRDNTSFHDKIVEMFKHKRNEDKMSGKFKVISAFMQEQNDEMMDTYIKKIDEQLIAMEKREEVEKTREGFKSINPQSSQEFFDLVRLEPQKDMLRFAQKHQLLLNFPDQLKKFNRDLYYMKYRNQKQLAQMKSQDTVDLRHMDLNEIKKVHSASRSTSHSNVNLPTTNYTVQDVRSAQFSASSHRGRQRAKGAQFFPKRENLHSQQQLRTTPQSLPAQAETKSTLQDQPGDCYGLTDLILSNKLTTNVSKQIKSSQIKYMMSIQSPIIKQAKIPQYLYSSREDFRRSLPVMLDFKLAQPYEQIKQYRIKKMKQLEQTN